MKKPICPQMAFFIVNQGIPTVSLGFSSEQSMLLSGILTAINNLTQAESGMGHLNDIQAKEGRIYIQVVKKDVMVGFFVWSRTGFPRRISQQMKVLAGGLGSFYLSEYLVNPAFEELLLIGSLPEKFQGKLAYQSVFTWRKQIRESPFRETDKLEEQLNRIDRSIFDHLGLDLSDLTFPEKIENAVDNAVWAAVGSILENDISPLITARNIDQIIPNLRLRIKALMTEEIRRQGPAALLKEALLQGVTFDWPR
ncbi:MAG: hypothetical protein JSV04_11015 [Candidatus Heimdallarchaeota archaeon]|nr:MAG: hypothetical protein JSV04_11015 [Candidatus Heimdallarchaeota archaeon]